MEPGAASGRPRSHADDARFEEVRQAHTQRAVVTVMNAIYEQDLLGFSNGFRPGRSQHDALDALATAICRRTVSGVLDADSRDYFGSISPERLVKFVEHRKGDRRVVRLIHKWLKAGVLEDGIKP